MIAGHESPEGPRGERSRDPSASVVAFTIGTVLAAVATAFVAHAIQGWPAAVPVETVPAFLALLIAAGHFLLRFHYRDDVEALDLFEAVLAPAIVVLPGVLVVALVVAAKSTVGIVHRNKPVKALFNVAQWAFAAGAGSIAFQALTDDNRLSGRTILAAVAALTVVTIVNQAAFITVIRLAQRQPVRAVLAGLSPVIVPGWVIGWLVNVAFGVLFAVSAAWSPWTIGLFIIPLLALHRAYQGYATVLADRTRMAGMHRATRALARPVDPRDAIPQFLAEIQACFQASSVELLLLGANGQTIHHVDAAGESGYVVSDRAPDGSLNGSLARITEATRLTVSDADPRDAALLDREGWRECLVAPLTEGDRTLGLLCVYDPGGLEAFKEGERAVIETLAVEAAHAMIKAGLLDTVLEERQKLSDIVERTSDGILTLGPGGMVKTWNAALERITGKRAADMIGSRMFASLEPRDVNGFAVWLEGWADADGLTLPNDIEITTSEGAKRWLTCSYTRVQDPDGRPSTLIVVARDTTEARELERLKDDFVATVSHELRTPLTPIKGWAVTLLQLGEGLSPNQRNEGVEAILRHSERLERLITNLLEVSKVERGLSDRSRAIVDVLAIAEKAIGDFRAESGNREILLCVSGEGHSTRGDEIWLEQILTNLLSNAVKYSPANLPIEVGIARSDGVIELTVTDHGPGIPEFEAERIFERFKRLGDHMTRSQGGTGLGLYIARQLARAIGGELTVGSAAGQGATFTLRLEASSEPVAVAS